MSKISKAVRTLSTTQKLTNLLSLTVFAVSLTQSAFFIDRAEDPAAYSDSLFLFLLGWMSFLGGAFVPFLFWLANPIYLAAIIFTFKNNTKALYLSGSATVIALVFSQLDSIMTSESGSYSKITSLGFGYVLWVISFMIMTLGTALNNYFVSKYH